MSYSRRLLLLGLPALAACGFTPVLAPGGSAEGLFAKVAVDDPRDASGFALVRQLENRLGLPQDPDYRLTAEIRVGERRLGITAAEEITRFQILGQVNFQLLDQSSGDVVTNGRVDSFTSYSATDTAFATRAAQIDARERLMVVLADQVVARLLATSGDWR